MPQILKTFISSANDLPNERKAAKKVIRKIRDSILDVLNVFLHDISWDVDPNNIARRENRTVQDVINERVKDTNIFILIVNRRYGSIGPGHTKSNTQREVELALRKTYKEREAHHFSGLFPEPIVQSGQGSTGRNGAAIPQLSSGK